jgi:hypothetical protein
MLPEYIIYDELKRQRKRDEVDDRPHLEVPQYMPYWPDASDEESDDAENERKSDVVIIQM